MTQPPAFRLLDRAAVVALGGADFAAAIADVRDALALLRSGDGSMPAETSVPLGTPTVPGKAYALPAQLGGRFQAAGVKWTAHRPSLGDGLPPIVSLTLVNDRQTGLPQGAVESALLTAMRTAAVSALALQTLVPGLLRRVAVLGAGFQARTHLAMLSACFPALESVTVWNRTAAGGQAAVASRDWPFGRIEAMESLEEAIQLADAIIACTSAASPILGPGAMRRGCLVMQVGYHEASFDAIDHADHVVVDLWGEFRQTSAKSLFQMHRAGRFPPERLAADLSEAVLDGWRPRPGSAVFFSSFGLNIFDVALASRILSRDSGHDTTAHLDLYSNGKDEWPWR